ncbi:MAG: metallophosphoesterase [Cyanobacteriota bacterium]|nr:metallophosphoesterase [Cyanobacteriota bacterium]
MSLTLAQITDTHLLADPTAELRGCNPWQSFQAVLREVMRCRPDGLLLTGDLADQGDRRAYEQLRDAIAPINRPIYWVPGNHDDGATAHRVLQGPQCYGPQEQGLQSIDLGSWRLLLLNSVLPRARFGEGGLAADTLRSLGSALSRHRHQPTALALHHHPVPTGIDWLDQMQVQNAAPLLNLLQGCHQVRLVLFGHIHLDFQQLLHGGDGGITCYGCPSTALQVIPQAATPDSHLPGFRLISLYPDGRHHSQVRRVMPGMGAQ